jgi:hypothetical protein
MSYRNEIRSEADIRTDRIEAHMGKLDRFVPKADILR